MAPVHRRLLLGFIGLALAGPVLADAPPRVGEVEALDGTAFARRGGVLRLARASAILLDDRVWTEARSRMTLFLSGGNRVHLGPSALLTVDRYVADAGGELTLEVGALIFDRPEAISRTDIEIRSVFGLIGVRGTRFFAGPSRGRFGLFVERGQVVFIAAGVRRRLGPGDGIDVARPGAPPSEVRRWSRDRIIEAYASVLG